MDLEENLVGLDEENPKHSAFLLLSCGDATRPTGLVQLSLGSVCVHGWSSGTRPANRAQSSQQQNDSRSVVQLIPVAPSADADVQMWRLSVFSTYEFKQV